MSTATHLNHFALSIKLRLQLEILLPRFLEPSLPGLESSVPETEEALKTWVLLYDRRAADGFTSFLIEHYEDVFRAFENCSRDSENSCREILGTAQIGEGWVLEVELLNMVREVLPREGIIR